MQSEIIKVKKGTWDGKRWRTSRESLEVVAEPVGEFFAIHTPTDFADSFRYTVTHIKTGWALCRVKTKAQARNAVKLALAWPGIDWKRLTVKAATDGGSIHHAGQALLVALAEAGAADDVRVVDGHARRTFIS